MSSVSSSVSLLACLLSRGHDDEQNSDGSEEQRSGREEGKFQFKENMDSLNMNHCIKRVTLKVSF